MDALDVSRWQFGITTVYHFILVPLTIGLAPMIAVMQTVWHVTGNEQWLRATKFFGKLFLINFAMGVVTGIVQEFQFGMNWSSYSRFVGDIFGAPLALEALLAFFLESTFLGLWIFGWGRIPERLHAACMWIVHVGTLLSAYFILAANSFMQHPVGYRINEETGRAEMADFVAILTNPVQLVAFPHVITACYLVGGAIGLPLSAWIAQTYDWHMLFWVSTVLAGLILAAVLFVLPDGAPGVGGRIDVIGSIGLAEAEVRVEAVPKIVAVEAVGRPACRNEPSFLPHIAEELARDRGEEVSHGHRLADRVEHPGRAGLGEVTVRVPKDMNVRANCTLNVGDPQCPEGLSVGTAGADKPVLTINAHANVGSVEVTR